MVLTTDSGCSKISFCMKASKFPAMGEASDFLFVSVHSEYFALRYLNWGKTVLVCIVLIFQVNGTRLDLCQHTVCMYI